MKFLFWFNLGIVAMMTAASGEPGFKLDSPSAYFSDAKSLALLETALNGDLSEAQRLVSAGADPDREGPMYPRGATRLRLLHYAVALNSEQGVNVLIEVGADPLLSAQNRGNALMFAVVLGNAPMLSHLLEKNSVSSLPHDVLQGLLFESVRLPRPGCLRVLLDRGAPIDLEDEAGYTILMDALSIEDLELATWLLERGASVTIQTANGVTPARQVQRLMRREEPGNERYAALQQIRKLMEDRGLVFP